MARVPADLRYTRQHEWARPEGDLARVGITDHAQAKLGDVVFVELPTVGKVLSAAEAFGVVESVKAVSDLFSPLSGEVVEVNGGLRERPELVNEDPYGAGWMLLLRVADPGELDALLTAEVYDGLTADE